MADTANTAPGTALKVATPTEIVKDLQLTKPQAIEIRPGQDQDLDAKADHFANLLASLDPQAPTAGEEGKTAVETMGAEVQKEAGRQMSLLQQPVKKLSGRAEDGGDVANALIDLKMKVEELDPAKFDFEPGWFSRALGALPGIGSPLKRYFTKFESAQTVIASVVRSLEQGKDQLLRDNITLGEDQKRMREMTVRLEKAIKLGQLIDQKLQYKLDREIAPTDPKHKFIAEELMFPLRQRIIDLQQQLAVNQQGILATELIVRNNKELARGVDRALNVTVNALQVAATVAMALANQKIVLDKIESVNKTTSDLIANTSARLKTQGVQIQKQAASAQIDMNSLKSAFADINQALTDLSQFRVNALPQMASTVLELDKITSDAEKTIKELEKGNQARPEIKIDV